MQGKMYPNCVSLRPSKAKSARKYRPKEYINVKLLPAVIPNAHHCLYPDLSSVLATDVGVGDDDVFYSQFYTNRQLVHSFELH